MGSQGPEGDGTCPGSPSNKMSPLHLSSCTQCFPLNTGRLCFVKGLKCSVHFHPHVAGGEGVLIRGTEIQRLKGRHPPEDHPVPCPGLKKQIQARRTGI